MKIGQLANIVGCTVEAVRFYEKQGLIEPAKRTSGNFRVYTEVHVKQLSFYLLLSQFGYFTKRNQNVAESAMCHSRAGTRNQ